MSMLKIFKLVVTLLISVVAYTSVYADQSFETTIEDTIEAYAFEVSTPEEDAAAKAFVTEKIEAIKASTPIIDYDVQYVDERTTESNKLYSVAFTVLKTSKDYITRNSANIFNAAVRGGINGGGAMLSFIIKQQAIIPSLEFGAVVAALCGTIQLLNEPIQKFVATNLASSFLKMRNSLSKSALDRAEELSKIFTIAFVFLCVLKVVGIQLELDDSTENALLSILSTTIRSAPGQIIFEVGNAKITQAAKQENPEKADVYQRNGNRRIMIFSCLNTIAQSIDTVLNIKQTASFAALTIVGIGFYLKGLLTKPSKENVDCREIVLTPNVEEE